MPSTIAHSIFGYSISRLTPQAGRSFYACAALLAVSPDLDFIPGIISGCVANYHRLATHSLFCLVPAAFLIWIIFFRALGFKAFILLVLAGLSHPVADMLQNTYGVAFFWPLNISRICFPFSIFHENYLVPVSLDTIQKDIRMLIIELLKVLIIVLPSICLTHILRRLWPWR